ncbi:hypothetical protein ACFC6L_13515 [Kitasatospora phosalacinea]
MKRIRAALPLPGPEPALVGALRPAPHEGPGAGGRELRAEHPPAVHRFRR